MTLKCHFDILVQNDSKAQQICFNTHMWIQPLAHPSPLAGPNRPEPLAPSAPLNFTTVKIERRGHQ